MLVPTFIQSLTNKLSQPLPGDLAHREMSARPVNGERFRFQANEHTKQGAVLIAFYQREGVWHFPLIQRPDYQGAHGGQISLPGGKIEEQDESLVQTALRETEEEIGLHATSVQVVGVLSSFFVGASNHQVLPVIGYVTDEPQFIPDKQEVDRVIEVPLDQLIDPNYKKSKQITIRGFELEAPYFDLNNSFVWGATAMMLNELVHILNKNDRAHDYE